MDNSSSQLESNLNPSEIDDGYTGDGSVDIKGNPILKENTGNWRACPFILGNECCERLAYYGISSNLVTYLTRKLHEGNVAAARNAAIWSGTCYLSPLIGAFLADAYWGRYWTIAVFSTIYFIVIILPSVIFYCFMGMFTLTLSAAVPALRPAKCVGAACPPASFLHYVVFFLGLYLIALGTGGIKPCVSSFGADQFDDTDTTERVKKGSFFNWFYFSIYVGALVSTTSIVWVQENAGWGLGFGIPTLSVGIAIACFFCGTPLYRFQKPGGSPVTRICQVLVASFRKWRLEVPFDAHLLYETSDKSCTIKGSRKLEHTDELKFLDKAAIVTDGEAKGGELCNPWRVCTVTQVEELKMLIRILPIWSGLLVFTTVYSQMSTTFVEQGMKMNRGVGRFTIPVAALSSFNVMSVIVCVPVYDRLVVPIARGFTGKERGFSQLQRIGIGLFVSVFAVGAAALVEQRRLQQLAVPISILWQIPQFLLIGVAEVFTLIGKLEFFYDQSPDAMRSLGSALALLTMSLGNYFSSLLVTVVSAVTAAGARPGWIPDNLNEGRLDYFFWLLAGLSFLNLLLFLVSSTRYNQKRPATN